MRAVTARDDSGAALAGGCDLAQTLSDAGLVPTLLAMLACLAPIQPSGGRPREPDDARGAELQPVAILAANVHDDEWPSRPPYRGYRGDLIAGELSGCGILLGRLRPPLIQNMQGYDANLGLVAATLQHWQVYPVCKSC